MSMAWLIRSETAWGRPSRPPVRMVLRTSSGRLIWFCSVMGVLGFVWLKPDQTTRGRTLSRPRKKGQDALRVFLRLRFAAPPEDPECVSQAEPLLQTDCCTTELKKNTYFFPKALWRFVLGSSLFKSLYGRKNIVRNHVNPNQKAHKP